MAKENKDFVIAKGNRYKEVDGNRFVNVFFVDNTRNDVRYSLEGRSSGREFSMDFDTFHESFEPAPLEKSPEKSSPLKRESRMSKDA